MPRDTPNRTFLDTAAHARLTAVHIAVCEILLKHASDQSEFWIRARDISRPPSNKHNGFARGMVLRHYCGLPLDAMASLMTLVLWRGIGKQTDRLDRLGMWHERRKAIIALMPDQEHRDALEELLALSVYAWFIKGRPKEAVNERSRNDRIAAGLPSLPDNVSWDGPAFFRALRAWWLEAQRSDSGPLLDPIPSKDVEVPIVAPAVTTAEPEPSPPTIKARLHPDWQPILEMVATLPASSLAWEKAALAQFQDEVASLGIARRAQAGAAALRQEIATAIATLSGHLDTIGADLDRVSVKRCLLLIREPISTFQTEVIYELIAACDAAIAQRALTDQQSGISREERKQRLEAFEAACDAASRLLQRFADQHGGMPPPPLEADPVTVEPAPTIAEIPASVAVSQPAEPAPVAEQDDATSAHQTTELRPNSAAIDPPSEPTIPDLTITHELPSDPLPSVIRAAPVELDSIASQIWTYADLGEFALAGHLAQLRDQSGIRGPIIPAWLFHGPLVGMAISGDGEGATEHAILGEIERGYVDCLQNATVAMQPGCHLLIAASLLRPAILLPQNGASAILGSLHLDGAARRFICDGIGDPRRPRIPIGMAAIAGARLDAVRNGTLEAVQDRAATWLKSSLRRKLMGPAKVVWDDWSRPGQELHRLVDAVRTNDVKAIPSVTLGATRWSDDHWFRNKIDATDHAIRTGAHHDIEARCERQLVARRDEVVSILREWLALVTATSSSRNQDHQERAAQHIRQLIAASRAAVTEELTRQANHPSVFVRVGAHALHAAIEDMARLFDPMANPQVHRSVPIRQRLDHDLVRISGLDLAIDEGMDPAQPLSERLAAFTAALATTRLPTTTEAIRGRISSGDLLGASYGLQGGPTLCDGGEHTQLEELCEKTLISESAKLRHESDRTLLEIEDIARQGTILSELDYQQYKAEVVTIQSRLARREIADFRKPRRILADIHGKLRSARAAQITHLHQRLVECQRDGRPLSIEDPSRRIVEDALARGNIIAAHEYLEQIEEGSPILMVEDQPVCAGFPGRHDRIHGYLAATITDQPLAAVQQLLIACQGGNPPTPLTTEDAEAVHPQAGDLVELWWSSRGCWRQGGDVNVRQELLRRILLAIGFQNVAVRADGDASHALFVVDTRAIQDRRVIPVSTFGSNADGRYHVLAVTTKHAQPADVVAQVHDIRTRSGPSQLLVLLFQAWSATQRQELARLACGGDHPATFLVIDDVLILGAALQREPLLTTLMRAAIPFAYVRPYVDLSRKAPGPIPPEIFYGRRREREAILDGASLVYGGRQLGKTALLKEIERLRHNPAQGQIAIYIDLLPMSQETILDDIWLTIATKLREKEVIPDANAAAIGPEKLLTHIRRFLQPTGNRLLLLLDEADRLLEKDGELKHEPWSVLRQLKSWMQETERRFHVVFAGLHAVQRTALGNNPLAHLGEDICIGPLRERDAEAARRLVVEPLALLGYRFETPDLVTRILSQANFYPSLIQLCCHALVDRLHAQRAKRNDPPPYVITAADVDETYGDPTLRKAIAEKFQITLNLDNRFRIIALAIALCDMDEERSRSYRTEDVQNLAMSYWPQGFIRAKTPSAFRGLLTELVGLGVLRQCGEDEFALRNINIVPLLGNRGMIEKDLREAQERKPDLPPDPKEARRAYERSGTRMRAPITAFNQELIRGRKRSGVIVICGGTMAGSGQVPHYLTTALSASAAINILPDPSALHVFQLQLENAFLKRSKDSGTIVVVKCSTWDSSWIHSAWKQLSGVRAKGRWMRVILILAPEQAWKHRDILSLEKHHLPDQDLDYARITLEPWTEGIIHDHFADDRGLSTITTQQERHILEMTGGWPWFIEHIPRNGQTSPDDAALELATRIETDPTYARHVLASYGCPEEACRLIALIGGLGITTDQWAPRLAQALACAEEQAQALANRLKEWLVHFDYAQPTGKGILAIDARLVEAARRIGQID